MIKFTLERQIQFAFLAAFLILVTISFFSYLSVNSLSETLKKSKQTQQILQNLNNSLVLTLNSETGSRGYALTGNEMFLQPYNESKDKILSQIQELRGLFKDNPQQLERFDKLDVEINQKLLFIQQTNELRRKEGINPAIQLINTGREKQIMDNIRSIIQEIETDELNILEQRESALKNSVSATYWMLLIGSLAGVISLGLANFAIFRETSMRTKAEDDLKEINKNLESRVEERTEQVFKANQELQEKSEFVRTTLDSLSAYIAVVDKKGEILVVNEQWEESAKYNFGHSFETKFGVGENYLEVYRRIADQDEDAKVVLENLEMILAGKEQTFRYEYPYHSPTESYWFILQINALQNEKGGAVISHFDITDRKKTENELKRSEEFNRSIFENSPDCVKVLELDGTLLSMNSNGVCLLEIDELQPFIGKNWADFWEGEAKTKAANAIQTAYNGNAESFEGYCKTAKGTMKYWEVSVNPIFGDDGKPIRLISTSRDITARKEYEQERESLLKSTQSARREAEIANQMRDEFLATVSHELRAPLNSILGWSVMLEQGNLDKETQQKAYEIIVRNAKSQNRLIEDLLDVSRIISGKVRLEISKCKINKLVETTLESVRPAADAKNISLEVREDSKISHVSADPNRLQQVIWNLLSNAIKFTPNDGKVIVDIKRLESEVEIRVVDTGIGIKKEFLPHVFKRFSQADASSIRKFGGLGLGLAIVRHITEMHGGAVKVESDGENKGSTFIVRLPILVELKKNKDDKFKQYLSKENSTKGDVSLDGMLILVVDDEMDTLQMIVQALTFYGATVITASSAAEALEEIKTKNPDVLVSDIGMPQEDGYSLISKLRALPNEKAAIPAIALTAFTRPQDRARALAIGFQEHISKPVEIEELATIIAQITGRLDMNYN